MVRIGQAPVGPRHRQRPAAARDAPGKRTAAGAERPDREPCRTLRADPRVALVLPRDARWFWLEPAAVSVFRRLPGCRRPHRRRGPMAPLPARFAGRDDAGARRAAVDPRRQAGAAAPALPARMRALRRGRSLLTHARTAGRCREHHDAGPLPRAADGVGDAHRSAEIRVGRPATRVESEAAGAQHRPHDGVRRHLIRRRAGGCRRLWSPGGDRGRRTPRQRARSVAHRVLEAGQPRGRLRRGVAAAERPGAGDRGPERARPRGATRDGGLRA